MTIKSEQKARTHGSILESAGRLLRQRGISGANVADVMKGAGLTVGGFYAHFGSKEKMIDAALRRTAAAMRTRLFARIEDKPVADRIEVLLKRYLSPAHRDDLAEGCPLPAVVGEIATTAEAHAQPLADELDLNFQEVERHVPAKSGLPGRHLAIGLFALMYGGFTLARATRGTPLSDEILRACRSFGKLLSHPESP
jgi:TetR/AcrR family transcriptional repressor of nem operon